MQRGAEVAPLNGRSGPIKQEPERLYTQTCPVDVAALRPRAHTAPAHTHIHTLNKKGGGGISPLLVLLYALQKFFKIKRAHSA